MSTTMSLEEEYKKQYQWRDWGSVFSALPIKQGDIVLENQASKLSELGYNVIGIDCDESLISAARSKNIHQATFHVSDL